MHEGGSGELRSSVLAVNSETFITVIAVVLAEGFVFAEIEHIFGTVAGNVVKPEVVEITLLVFKGTGDVGCAVQLGGNY